MNRSKTQNIIRVKYSKITEYFNQEWKKDSVPFWMDGDITINKVPYQIKFESASFINEKLLAKLN